MALLKYAIFVSLLMTIEGSKSERDLIEYLFDNYSTDVRPVEKHEQAVNITMKFSLYQIINVEEKDQTIEISAWLQKSWYDYHLSWDPKEFGNITEINVCKSKFWLPDIVLFNSVSDDVEFGGRLDSLNTRVIVNYTGGILWLSAAILRAHCEIRIKYFPFDTQECSFKFASWTYDTTRLVLQPYNRTNININEYMENTEWRLVLDSVDSKDVTYACCGAKKFSSVTFSFRISRRSLFFILNLIFPIAIIAMLTIFAFLLPAESGERISLAVTMLLSVAVFMLMVADTTPPTSKEIPLVTVYFITSLSSMIIMIITMCYVSQMYHKHQGDKPMGYWMRRIILDKLSFILGIQHPQKNYRSSNSINSAHMTANNSEMKGCLTGNVRDDVRSPVLVSNIGTNESDMMRAIKQIEKTLFDKMDVLVQKVNADEEEDRFITEWRIAAMTIDRSLLILFLLIFVLTLIACFSFVQGYFD